MELVEVQTEFKVKFESLEISLAEVTEYLAWCTENKSDIEKLYMFWFGDGKNVTSEIKFTNDEMAMAFKLRWL